MNLIFVIILTVLVLRATVNSLEKHFGISTFFRPICILTLLDVMKVLLMLLYLVLLKSYNAESKKKCRTSCMISIYLLLKLFFVSGLHVILYLLAKLTPNTCIIRYKKTVRSLQSKFKQSLFSFCETITF